jgi:hypothetical protein
MDNNNINNDWQYCQYRYNQGHQQRRHRQVEADRRHQATDLRFGVPGSQVVAPNASAVYFINSASHGEPIPMIPRVTEPRARAPESSIIAPNAQVVYNFTGNYHSIVAPMTPLQQAPHRPSQISSSMPTETTVSEDSLPTPQISRRERRRRALLDRLRQQGRLVCVNCDRVGHGIDQCVQPRSDGHVHGCPDLQWVASI